MLSGEWDRLKTLEERRRFRIREQAYFLSTHREKEGRPPDPERDWLNAEWIEDNLETYCGLERDVNWAMSRVGGGDRSWMTPFSCLRAHGETQEQLSAALAVVVTVFTSKLDVARAVSQSNTFAGLMEELVTQIRCNSH